MDRPRDRGVVRFDISYKTVILLCYYYVLAAYIVMVGNIMLIPKSVILLEGIYFGTAYYLRTLNGPGTRLLMVGHIFSIIPMYTNLRILSVVTMTWFSTVYPVFSMYTSLLFSVRLLLPYAYRVTFLLMSDTVECYHVLLGLAYIVYYYIFHFTRRSREDVVMVVVVLVTAWYLPYIQDEILCIMATTFGFWVEYKSYFFEPISMFPVRSLGSLSFFR